MTFKSDGKSSASSSFTGTSSEPNSKDPISEKFTQRPKNEDTYYEEHDVKDTHDYKKEQLGSRFYFAVGLFMVFVGFLIFMDNSEEKFIDQERDETLAKLERESKTDPFDEA